MSCLGLLDLSYVPIMNILSFLPVRDLGVFSQVSKNCKFHATEAIKKKQINCGENESGQEKIIEKWKTFFISAISNNDNSGKICMFKVYFSDKKIFVFKLISDKKDNFNKTYVLPCEDTNRTYHCQQHILDDHKKPVSGLLAEYIFKKAQTEVFGFTGCNHWMISQSAKEETIHCMSHFEDQDCTQVMPGMISVGAEGTEENSNQKITNIVKEVLERTFTK